MAFGRAAGISSGSRLRLLTAPFDRGRYLTPTDEDIEGKFRLIAVPVLGPAKAESVIGLVRRLETLRDIGELIQALKPQ